MGSLKYNEKVSTHALVDSGMENMSPRWQAQHVTKSDVKGGSPKQRGHHYLFEASEGKRVENN